MGFVKDTVDNITGKSGEKAARASRDIQQAATDQAIAFQEESRDLARQDLAPYNLAGASRLNKLTQQADGSEASAFGSQARLNSRLDSRGEDWTKWLQGVQAINYDQVPGFQDASNTMARQVNSVNAARGKLGSGQTLNDLFKENAQLGTSMKNNLLNNYMGIANFDENQYANRFARQFDAESYGENNRRNLFQQNYNLANMGQASAAGQAAAAQNTGIADMYQQRGNIGAAGNMGAQNASIGGTNNLISLASMAYGASGGLGGGGTNAGNAGGLFGEGATSNIYSGNF